MSPRKTKYDKEKVIMAAFKILREKGWTRVTARSIAELLGASTMPIYSTVESMKELEKELQRRAFQILNEYQLKKYTDNPYLNAAVGYVFFAKEEPHLFRFLFFERPKKISTQELMNLRRHLPQEVRELPLNYYFTKLSLQELDVIQRNSWIYTHGLAVLIYSGILTEISDKDIIHMLESAGRAFYEQRIWKKDKDKNKKNE